MDRQKLDEMVDRQMQLPASYMSACPQDRLAFQLGCLTGTLKSLLMALNDETDLASLASAFTEDVAIISEDGIDPEVGADTLLRLRESCRTLERMAVAVKAALR